MNRDNLIGLILVGIVLMDIMDGDFVNPSILDIVKWLLLIICFALVLRRNKDGK